MKRFKRSRFVVAALAAAMLGPLGQARLGSAPATTQSAEAHGQSLFDGKTLAGWEGDPKIWRVEDGVIVGGSTQGNAHNAFLATEGRYGDFVLRVEYKLTGTEGFINSGVQFRSERMEKPAYEMIGYQADIGVGYTGSVYDESRRKKALSKPEAALINRLEKLGDWNVYEVRCEGPRIRLYLNGEQTVDYTEPDEKIPLTGRIGLQIHGGAKSEVRFRNITIQTLAEKK